MNTRRVLTLIVALSLAAYGVSILVNALETINAIAFQSNYYSTGGGHAIMLAATVAIGIGILCMVPGILVVISVVTKKHQVKREHQISSH